MVWSYWVSIAANEGSSISDGLSIAIGTQLFADLLVDIFDNPNKLMLIVFGTFIAVMAPIIFFVLRSITKPSCKSCGSRHSMRLESYTSMEFKCKDCGHVVDAHKVRMPLSHQTPAKESQSADDDELVVGKQTPIDGGLLVTARPDKSVRIVLSEGAKSSSVVGHKFGGAVFIFLGSMVFILGLFVEFENSSGEPAAPWIPILVGLVFATIGVLWLISSKDISTGRTWVVSKGKLEVTKTKFGNPVKQTFTSGTLRIKIVGDDEYSKRVLVIERSGNSDQLYDQAPNLLKYGDTVKVLGKVIAFETGFQFDVH